eukprot:scaffold88361_cov51-Phaeocystis_antarctica.AAC.2
MEGYLDPGQHSPAQHVVLSDEWQSDRHGIVGRKVAAMGLGGVKIGAGSQSGPRRCRQQLRIGYPAAAAAGWARAVVARARVAAARATAAAATAEAATARVAAARAMAAAAKATAAAGWATAV